MSVSDADTAELPPEEKWSVPSAEQLLPGIVLIVLGLALYFGHTALPDLYATYPTALKSAAWLIGLIGNALVLKRLPFPVAVAVVWIELLAGFVLFCGLFDLQPDYVLSKSGALLGYQVKDGFVQGTLLTLFICAISITLAVIIALLAALAKLFAGGGLYGLTTFYISFFRGTPLLLQVLIIYLGLPQIGWTISAIPAGVMALALNYGAYMAEIFRSGIQAINRGQWEASDALGMSQRQAVWYVILPQSMRLIVPATGNQFIMMLKDSSLVSVMGVWELMYVARAIGRTDFRYMEMLIAAAVIYWALSAVLEIVQARLEKYYSRGTRR